MRITRALIAAAFVLPLAGCPGDGEKTPTSGPSDPAVGETGPAEVPPAPAPAAGETGSAPGPVPECTELLAACESDLKICEGAK